MQVLFKELPGRLAKRIGDKVPGKRPVFLSEEDLREILTLVETRTDSAIVGNIRVDDPGFLALRGKADIGCRPRAPRKC